MHLAARLIVWLALLWPLAAVQPALAQQPAPAATISASPGKSGGEGGGSGVNTTLREATKEDPILQSSVGQPAGPPQGNDPTSRCLRLAYADFTALKDAPTQMVDAAVRPATATAPAVCIVNAFVAPQVSFRMWLPLEAWNGKMMQTGCGGRCGEILTTACEFQFTRGYACIANDLGHRGTTYDMVWAIDDVPAEIDMGFRATHVANIAGRAITKAFYSAKPKYVYFVGASQGGRQGLVGIQRFPGDYDGVVSGEPGFVNAQGMSGSLAPGGGKFLFQDGKAVLTADEIRMVHKAVLATCDMDDGLKDGIVIDPRACAFQPRQLLCKAAKTLSCLTQVQVAALENVYSTGPRPGSELGWIGAYVAADGTAGRYMPKTVNAYSYPYSWVFMDSSNPDIRAYKARGGKFILYQGWADEVVNTRGPVDYYETVERLMGGRDKTQDFFRFFVVPGQSHIPGNVGAESLDYIVALETWVETGKAPDVLIGRKLKRISQMMGPMYLPKDLQPSNVLYSRPIYPYPIQARYKGQGDPDDAANFGPWDPARNTWAK